MKKLIILLLILTLSSCSLINKGVEVHIKNNTSETITQVQFTTTEEIEVVEIDKIAPGETATQFLSMRKNKIDGAYTLHFNRANGEKERTIDDYYTNGCIDQRIDVNVEDSSTIMKFDNPTY